MSDKLRILIAGDLFMIPQAFQDALEQRLAGEHSELDFRTVEYPYPVDGLPLPDTILPTKSEGAWDGVISQPRGEDETAEVSEYYGEINHFVGRVTDEDILIVHLAPITRAVLEAAKNLKLIACCRGGPKNINVDAATRLGIAVVNTPGRNSLAVAEFAVGALLAHTRNIVRGHEQMVQGIWNIGAYRYEHVGPQLRRRTAGIIGLGNVGKEISRILSSGFQARVIAYDPYVAASQMEAFGATKVELDTLLRQSDFVFLCARLTPESAGMIGARELARMKPTAYVVNTARGGILDYHALTEVLRERRIAGATLDVFAGEPLARDDRLLQLDNVTLTPHIAGASCDVLQHCAGTIAEEVWRFLHGEPLRNCLNPQVLA